jgi:hypothetical protein
MKKLLANDTMSGYILSTRYAGNTSLLYLGQLTLE